jgi:hypothetical protein
MAVDSNSPSAPRTAPSATELLAFFAFLAAINIGWGLAFWRLPPLPGHPAFFGPAGNWFRQEGWWMETHTALLLLFVYTAKRLILRRVPPARAVMWYMTIALSVLPYIWFFVVVDWFNRHVFRIECWVGYPIAILTVPTVTFLWDRLNPDGPGPLWYLIRSTIEIVLVTPVFVVIWMYFSMVLGWIWI